MEFCFVCVFVLFCFFLFFLLLFCCCCCFVVGLLLVFVFVFFFWVGASFGQSALNNLKGIFSFFPWLSVALFKRGTALGSSGMDMMWALTMTSSIKIDHQSTTHVQYCAALHGFVVMYDKSRHLFYSVYKII